MGSSLFSSSGTRATSTAKGSACIRNEVGLDGAQREKKKPPTGTSEPDGWYPYPPVNASPAQQDAPPPKRLRKSLTALVARWYMRRGVRILRLNRVSSHDFTDKTKNDRTKEIRPRDFLVLHYARMTILPIRPKRWPEISLQLCVTDYRS